MNKHFADIDTFYALRGGLNSPEMDFGVWWTDGPGRERWRVSVVHDTGDIYAIGGWSRKVELIGALTVGECRERIKHTSGCAYNTAERLLDGWSDSARPLSWARERLSAEAPA